MACRTGCIGEAEVLRSFLPKRSARSDGARHRDRHRRTDVEARSARPLLGPWPRRRAALRAPCRPPSAHSVRDRTVTARELPKATRSFGRLRFDGWDWRRLQGVVQCRSGGCCPLTASLCGDSLRSQVSTLRVRRPSTWVRCALAAPGVARAGAAGSRTAEARFSKHRRGSSDCRVTPCILTIVPLLYSSGWERRSLLLEILWVTRRGHRHHSS